MAAAPVALVAQKGVKALTADLVVVEGRFFRKVKRRVPTGRLTPKGRPGMRTEITLEPVDVSAHLNPVSIAIGAGVGLVGIGIGMWMLGLAVNVRTDEEKARLEEGVVLADELLGELEALRLQVEAEWADCKRPDRNAVKLRNCLDSSTRPDAIAYCHAQYGPCDVEEKRSYALPPHTWPAWFAEIFEPDHLEFDAPIGNWYGTYAEVYAALLDAIKFTSDYFKSANRAAKYPFYVGQRDRWPALINFDPSLF